MHRSVNRRCARSGHSSRCDHRLWPRTKFTDAPTHTARPRIAEPAHRVKERTTATVAFTSSSSEGRSQSHLRLMGPAKPTKDLNLILRLTLDVLDPLIS